MPLRHLHILLLLTSLTWGMASCSKIEEELPEGPPIESPDEGEDSDGNEVEGDTLSVVKALQCTPDDWVIVKGYIVGYVNGTTMSKAQFSAPTEKANTNILIADSKKETDHKRCLPIQIKSNTDEYLLYNLLTTPQLLGAPIAIEGSVTTYFRVNGFKYPHYWITKLTEEGADTPPEEDVPTPSPDPDPEPQPESDVPTLDFTPQANICGR